MSWFASKNVGRGTYTPGRSGRVVCVAILRIPQTFEQNIPNPSRIYRIQDEIVKFPNPLTLNSLTTACLWGASVGNIGVQAADKQPREVSVRPALQSFPGPLGEKSYHQDNMFAWLWALEWRCSEWIQLNRMNSPFLGEFRSGSPQEATHLLCTNK
jgi:hypothetical protein